MSINDYFNHCCLIFLLIVAIYSIIQHVLVVKKCNKLQLQQKTYQEYPNLFKKENWKKVSSAYQGYISVSFIFIPTQQPYTIWRYASTWIYKKKKFIMTLDGINNLLNSQQQAILYDFLSKLFDETNHTKVCTEVCENNNNS